MQLPIINKVTKKSNPWLLGLLAAGLVGVPAAAFVALRGNAPQTNVKEYTVPVTQKDVTVRITANGEVIPVQRLNLNPKTAGRLAELYVEQGDRVQQGQIIARMDSRELEAQRQKAVADLARAEANLDLLKAGSRSEAIGRAEAGVNQAQAEIAAAQTRLDLATQRVQRNQTLAAEGAISRDRLDEVVNEQRSAQANLEQAKARYTSSTEQLRQERNGSRVEDVAQAAAQVEAARASLQAIETQVEDTTIRAPFAGIITQKNATEGDFVTPTSFASSTSSATSIVTLANDLEILAKVPEVDIGQIKPGQEVEIKVDAYPNQMFKGVVRLISPEAKEDTAQRGVITFEVRVRMITGKDKLRSGMTADLAFLGQRVDNALMVPTVAIITNKGQTGVLVPDRNNKPTFQPVTIGPNIGNETKIMDGVKPGDPVFVELPEGQKLENIIKGMEKQ
uniref:Efflux RND transporter periplasmic adaptor subunit n=1 Tax=Oscillatoriales cyanobacterium SpSt-402 TaxID=2282168 RepID=A0A832HB74_9CYAN